MPPNPALAQRLSALRLACIAAGAVFCQAAVADADAARSIEQRLRRGEVAAAWQQLDQALAQQPGDAPLRFLRAVLLAESGKTAQAATLYERMTQDFPELPEPHNNLAVLRAAEGQLDAARGLLDTALQLAPGYRTARENLGDVHVLLALRAYGQASSSTDTLASSALLQRKLAMARELAGLR